MYGKIHTLYSTYTVDWPVQRPSVLENQLPEKGKSANERLNRKHVRVPVYILFTSYYTCVYYIGWLTAASPSVLLVIAGSRSRSPPAAASVGKGLCMDQPQTMKI